MNLLNRLLNDKKSWNWKNKNGTKLPKAWTNQKVDWNSNLYRFVYCITDPSFNVASQALERAGVALHDFPAKGLRQPMISCFVLLYLTYYEKLELNLLLICVKTFVLIYFFEQIKMGLYKQNHSNFQAQGVPKNCYQEYKVCQKAIETISDLANT